MTNTNAQPTAEMVAFYQRRTKEHIERVHNCLHAISDATDYRIELLERAKGHDASKFSEAERIPYIWMTESHRCRRAGESFIYPEGVEELVRAAVAHHLTSNRHHPDFHADPNDMTDVDLIEMVCDWTAMAQEFGEHDGSAKSYADRTIGSRLHFNDERRQFVYQTIALLDSRIRAQLDGQ